MGYGNSFSTCLEQVEDPKVLSRILQRHVAGGIKMSMPVRR